MTTPPIHVIGGGLAGTEAAWQSAMKGVPAIIHEMRPNKNTEAHVTGGLAELVCSNSFRSDDLGASAIGLLHEELRFCDSIIMKAADAHRVPAGSALAVDRIEFSSSVSKMIEAEPLITIVREEVTDLMLPDWGHTIIATGPLTSAPLTDSILQLTGKTSLAFFDAIAPVIYKDSIDFSKAWYQSRYDHGGGADYINCPLNKNEYTSFIKAILDGQPTPFKDWERDTPYFEGCLPIEVMASRGFKTLSYGPMKPVGLKNPYSSDLPYAIVQLRQDNTHGTLYNMVGFQTKLQHNEQTRIFRSIPGLENARFARLGGIHRNTFLNSPQLLDSRLRLKTMPRLRFAGQITGVEGYVESAAIGLLAGRFSATEQRGDTIELPPPSSAICALLNYITVKHAATTDTTFQPMNINFGLLPPLKSSAKRIVRRQNQTNRALADLKSWNMRQGVSHHGCRTLNVGPKST